MAMRTASARWITDWVKNRVVGSDWLSDQLPDSTDADAAQDIFYLASVLTAIASGGSAGDVPEAPVGDVGQIIRVVSGQAVRVGVVPVAPPEAAGVESAPETRILLYRAGFLPTSSHRLIPRRGVSNGYDQSGVACFVRSNRSPNECPQGP